MSSTIRVLDEQTINQIAAGEVIENPASVIKELIDNSVDSGASTITIEIVAGGRQLIRITDNGCGMTQDDALLSFERHATSKIKNVDDITNIYTMGFRGEAVPSIASISKYTLITSPHKEGSKGTLIIVEGGKILKCSEASCAPGTTTEVKSLFFNVPVRKKFQRSPNYDTQEILKMVTKLSLAHPNIKFELISNQESILKTKSCFENNQKQLTERIEDVLGKEFVEKSVYLHIQEGELKIEGYISLPHFSKHNRTGQYLFINKRPVFSPLIHNAIRDGFGTTLSTNRHPQFVLHMEIPGEMVDINVHPQKKEVRLRQETDLKKTISRAIDQALHQSGIAPVLFSENDFDRSPTFLEDSFAGFSVNPDHYLMEPSKQMNTQSPFVEVSFETLEEQLPEKIVEKQFEFIKDTKPAPCITLPKILTTIPGYILLESENNQEGFSLLDQKAAHNRIIFENLQKKNKEKTIEAQSLLIPYTLHLSSHESSLLLQLLPLLNSLGIHIKEFGKNTFLIDALPTSFGTINIENFTQNLVQNLLDDNLSNISHEIEKKMARIATKTSLSSKRKLSILEADSLLKQLFLCQTHAVCPYGKPVIVNITNLELAKYFQN